jgi:hypothetical protein
MGTKLRRSIEIIRTEGFRDFFRVSFSYILRHIRRYTPRITVEYNDVSVPRYRLADRWDPQKTIDPRPEYEGTFVAAVNSIVKEGDYVVILGGGVGVTTVHAARSTGQNGEVDVFEGAKEMFDIHEATLRQNLVPATVRTEHSIVGSGGKLWGKKENATTKDPHSLLPADVFIVDIEGAEADVIPQLPDVRAIIVETHGTYDSPTEDMQRHLELRGYDVSDAGVAEPSMAQEHEKNDVRVLIAER